MRVLIVLFLLVAFARASVISMTDRCRDKASLSIHYLRAEKPAVPGEPFTAHLKGLLMEQVTGNDAYALEASFDGIKLFAHSGQLSDLGLTADTHIPLPGGAYDFPFTVDIPLLLPSGVYSVAVQITSHANQEEIVCVSFDVQVQAVAEEGEAQGEEEGEEEREDGEGGQMLRVEAAWPAVAGEEFTVRLMGEDILAQVTGKDSFSFTASFDGLTLFSKSGKLSDLGLDPSQALPVPSGGFSLPITIPDLLPAGVYDVKVEVDSASTNDRIVSLDIQATVVKADKASLRQTPGPAPAPAPAPAAAAVEDAPESSEVVEKFYTVSA